LGALLDRRDVQVTELEKKERLAMETLESAAPAVRDATEAMQRAVDERDEAKREVKDAHRRRLETAALLHAVIDQKEHWKKKYIAEGIAFAAAQHHLWDEVEKLAIIAGRTPNPKLQGIMAKSLATTGHTVTPDQTEAEVQAAMDAVQTAPGPAATPLAATPVVEKRA
jgi:hypothetical protein